MREPSETTCPTIKADIRVPLMLPRPPMMTTKRPGLRIAGGNNVKSATPRVIGRPSSTEPGLLVYIMVDSVAATIDVVIANGGQVVQPIGMDAPEITARFSDPAGNVIGLYQQPS